MTCNGYTLCCHCAAEVITPHASVIPSSVRLRLLLVAPIPSLQVINMPFAIGIVQISRGMTNAVYQTGNLPTLCSVFLSFDILLLSDVIAVAVTTVSVAFDFAILHYGIKHQETPIQRACNHHQVLDLQVDPARQPAFARQYPGPSHHLLGPPPPSSTSTSASLTLHCTPGESYLMSQYLVRKSVSVRSEASS
ncbi:uncharacterized protein V1518DRAFT_421329 [Limtongia smithiae]|uniref:uncharacterized protein n=1 Tax=Limtongia smithiae TaxID=1125753 RepID=UPI0034CFD996